ncbi:Sodium/hydrogen exchanger family-domain-containing protein [Lasiosphaeris hirsuta]|uniref:Sodium/hydrogen exchanger family-domain-containing protein n=1 Tax=Lasiosphaeris hirsuta TaxID=260670 RepID=A0AA40A2Z8_9PEZI|nr:Sodium/hydrogen exchanger family-domain-containing protein [Lasiosphaeris hirsuta]
MATAVTTTVAATSSAVPPQAGILEGANPAHYTASNPITLFIIQASLAAYSCPSVLRSSPMCWCLSATPLTHQHSVPPLGANRYCATIVIIFCQLLHYPLRLLNQPRVIAEVIGGIILGPSVMMRIPGFKNTIFPAESMPVFNNVANLGLIIFLFLVALEVDVRMFTQNWKVAVSVGLAGMILPFGLGFAIAYGLFHQFSPPNISFGVFGLFIGTALSITAFPVLCRILTELNLLRSNVGVTVLAAGIGNDVTGWVLLALCVALVNNNSGLAALWALLCGIGWTLFLIFAVRPPFIWILRRTGSLQNGPTQGMVALTLLMVLTSAFFTGIIGIHAIFGAFLVGLICPHDGGFAIKLTEKIEDLISVLFLPLYFALSGLSTNLGALNDGITWGYVIAVIACAFSGKIIGGTLAARANKLLWRESFTIGCLMSCKGLVELIVLNIGYQAKILDERTFTMFVVMALVTTVATTPLTKALYPPWYQKKVEKWRRGETDWDGNPIEPSSSSRGDSLDKLNETQIRRLLVYLRLDSLPGLFTFITLLGGDMNPKVATPAIADAALSNEIQIKKRPLEVHGLRIIELTDRTSSVMHVTEGEEFYSQRDPVVNAFRAFSQLHDLAVAGRVAVVPEDSYADTLMTQASEVSSDFALIPWGEYGSITEDQSVPFAVNASERFRGTIHLDFIHQTLQKARSTCNAGIFIDNGFGGIKPAERSELVRTTSAISIRSYRETAAALPVANKNHHIFFPFIGGVDDRVALRIILQLAKNPHVTASIVHINWQTDPQGVSVPEGSKKQQDVSVSENSKNKKEVEEDITAQDLGLLATLQSSLPQELVGRVVFSEVNVAPGTAVAEVLALAQRTVGQTPKNAGDIVVLGRRHARLGDVIATEVGSGSNYTGSPDLKKTVGNLAEQLVTVSVKASVLIIQAGGRALDM